VSPLTDHSCAQPPTTPRRRSGREGPQALTAAFRRYVARVQLVAEPTPRTDLHAALRLAGEIAGCAALVADPSVVAVHGPAIRQLARGVRHAGAGAVGQPALLARAIVLGRTLASAAASARAGATERRLLAGASR
jgi:hypothetical protein